MKLNFDSCLNHVKKPIITGEKLYPSLSHPNSVSHIEREIIHKTFHFLFGKPNDSITMSKIKENIYLLKENQLMQQEKIKW